MLTLSRTAARGSPPVQAHVMDPFQRSLFLRAILPIPACLLTQAHVFTSTLPWPPTRPSHLSPPSGSPLQRPVVARLLFPLFHRFLLLTVQLHPSPTTSMMILTRSGQVMTPVHAWTLSLRGSLNHLSTSPPSLHGRSLHQALVAPVCQALTHPVGSYRQRTTCGLPHSTRSLPLWPAQTFSVDMAMRLRLLVPRRVRMLFPLCPEAKLMCLSIAPLDGSSIFGFPW